MSEWRGIWVFVEQDDGELERASLEILTRAGELGGKFNEEVYGVLLGHELSGIAEEASRYGADKLIIVDHPELRHFNSDAYTEVLSYLINKYRPRYMLLPATRNSRDIAGRLAVRFRTCLSAHVISVDIDEKDRRLVTAVPGFGGNIVATVVCTGGKPEMATVSPGTYEARAGSKRAVLISETVPEELIKKRRIELVGKERTQMIDLSRAERVVVAGLGTGGDLELINEFAKLINASVGVTRPLADMGLVPRDYQVGTTGVSLRAKLAFVFGASGAPHFVYGIRDCGTVVAVNTDREAPIFEHCDYCIVADLFEILRALIKELRGG
ncbi:electron transfer flavoprotein subunit alpha/FixB family protein [Vulcanisaeta thermophila]|uniref:electron transfer flavoprotein subunit alpha/FixB family protein n=1 Tax=Vulcanisaeta thermophila TaxID=867917 RepID=UPI000853DC34|nr:electron transfer flavoprotein subunit alpha/FixB family protein [Vulcanisaeta thermophila]